ncbi:hypothetical protein COCMIDRAFT_30268 [Bipolaris oryzae ATCC 44560]|uniref:O-methyltransferase C-terminal domain-containing protein n=1 Tax=Bipolaris oryzae ATCC 44560 TaxID=930090 RepID=W6ZAU6_COCMI|nr:uncharacterized protein COCMIDRAFT_30268 [Bipolaris oryzae ATCC 44560]EUC40846.1 hypothetical protein COCMIDRAFT_30268 [Bipolaris oryzae ATCC 44560]
MIIDIGGGGGGFIAMLLRAHKSLKGGIFDLPHVIEYAKSLFHSADGQFADIAAHVPVENLIGGDFSEVSHLPKCIRWSGRYIIGAMRMQDALREQQTDHLGGDAGHDKEYEVVPL